MTEQENSRSAANELLFQYHANEAAYLQSKMELTDYLRSLVGTNILIHGFTSENVIASSVSSEGEVTRKLIVSSHRRLNQFKGERDLRIREPLLLKNVHLDNINKNNLRVSLDDIEPPVQQYQKLGYIFNLNDIIRLEPVPSLVK